MRAVHAEPDAGRLDLDTCPRCRLVWFDPTEMGRFAPPRDPVSEEDAEHLREHTLPLEARVAIAKLKVQQIAAEANPNLAGDALTAEPDQPWQWIPAIMGLPIEVDQGERNRIPWATWTTSGLILILALLALADPHLTVPALGLVPSDPWRGAGLTWLSSLIVHGGLWHLASNLYFLLLVGDDVEEVTGPARWVAIFLLGGIAGSLCHVLFDPRPDLPLVGASGAISALIAYYALRFPGARMALVFRLFWRFAFLKIPVFVAVAFWLLMQVFGAVAQRSGCTRVSAFAHLGGFAVGVAFWGWSMRDRLRTPERG